jgi:tetratricopeptide (TPR) repeat protein
MAERATQGMIGVDSSPLPVGRPSTRWLHGPASDLLFGCGLFYLLVFVALGATGSRATEVVPQGLLPLLAIFAGAPHYGATLLRVYEHRESRRKYAFFAVGITALLGAAFVVSLFEYALGTLLVTLYFNWNSWHYAGQNYGLAMMFLRRRGVEVAPRAKQLFYASFLLSSAIAIVAMNGGDGIIYAPDSASASTRQSGPVYQFIPIGLPDPALTGLLVTGLVAYLGCLAGAIGMLLRRGSVSDLMPALLLVLTQSMWFVIPVAARHWGVFGGFLPLSQDNAKYTFMWIALGHSLQYLWVTSYFAKRTESYPGNTRYWLRCLFAGSMLWNVPGLILAPFALGTVAYTEGLSFLIAAVANLHHFILDGAIWKLRDAGIGRILLLQPRVSRGEAGIPDPTRRHWGRIALAVFGTCSVMVALTYTLENEFGFRRAYRRGDVARMEAAVSRLELIGRASPDQYRRLASLARLSGDDERALAALDQSLAIRDHLKSHFEKGHIYFDRKDWNAAADCYERAYALDPYPVPLIHQLAVALLAAGRVERARQVLEAGLALHPNHAKLSRQLQIANRRLLGAAPPQ